MDPAIEQHVRETVRNLAIWMELLRYVSLAVTILIAAFIWQGLHRHPLIHTIVLTAGAAFVIWFNVEVYQFTGNLDLFGMLAFVPLIAAVVKLYLNTRTGF